MKWIVNLWHFVVLFSLRLSFADCFIIIKSTMLGCFFSLSPSRSLSLSFLSRCPCLCLSLRAHFHICRKWKQQWQRTWGVVECDVLCDFDMQFDFVLFAYLHHHLPTWCSFFSIRFVRPNVVLCVCMCGQRQATSTSTTPNKTKCYISSWNWFSQSIWYALCVTKAHAITLDSNLKNNNGMATMEHASIDTYNILSCAAPN